MKNKNIPYWYNMGQEFVRAIYAFQLGLNFDFKEFFSGTKYRQSEE